MESQTEVVIAAEALRVWVRGQRAAWAEPDDRVPVAPPVPPAREVAAKVPAPAVTAPPPAPSPEVISPRQASVPSSPASTPMAAATPTPTTPPVSTPSPIPTPSSVASAPPVAAASPSPIAFPAPVPVFSPAPISPAAAPKANVEQSEPPNTVHIATSESPARRLPTWRVAAAAALVALVLGGGGLMWRRGASAPRVGTAAFDSLPPGAQVFVDGKPVGTTPVRVELNPGPHAVEFKLKNATRTQTIEIAKGAELPVNIDWSPKRTGGLQVTSTPTPAKVLIDGKERGQTPFTIDDLPVGAHTVQIVSSAGSVRRKVEVTGGQTETLAESIYPGWLQVSTPIDVTVSDGGKALQLDDAHRVLLKPGTHAIRIDNKELDFSLTRQVDVEPGATARVDVEVPTSTLTVTGPAGAEVFVDGTKAGEIPLADYQLKLGTRDVMMVEPSGATRHVTLTVTTRPAQVDMSTAR